MPRIMKTDSIPAKPSLGAVFLQAVIPLIVGAVFHYKGRPVAAGILYGVSSVMLVSGLFIPVLFHRIEKLGQALGRVVSTGITWILLVPLFYLVFVPGRLILKLRGLDPMCRQFPTDASTYWVPRKPVVNIDEYKRQF